MRPSGPPCFTVQCGHRSCNGQRKPLFTVLSREVRKQAWRGWRRLPPRELKVNRTTSVGHLARRTLQRRGGPTRATEKMPGGPVGHRDRHRGRRDLPPIPRPTDEAVASETLLGAFVEHVPIRAGHRRRQPHGGRSTTGPNWPVPIGHAPLPVECPDSDTSSRSFRAGEVVSGQPGSDGPMPRGGSCPRGQGG